MLAKLLLIFTVIPLIELTILMLIGQLIGLWATIALVIITGIVGAVMVKIEGISVVMQILGDLRNGVLPGRGMVDGVLILIGGIMLITPGIMTDIAGLLLVFPGTRILFREKTIKWLKKKLLSGSLKVQFFDW